MAENKQSFVIFPTGSRYSDKLKSGYLLVAKDSGKPIVPAKFEYKKWGHSELIIGEPYHVSKTTKLNKKAREIYNSNLEAKFATL
ncbi:hypothetical protein LFYK43_16370 [Ligilactobacillus salitolerans]|uniref:Uncharacterized protein n=1 Tax=Ligilactobacillus salitolerans TaxID=1808352 RepID=A0A401IUK3_9LACO|nr:hypothetical protein LFYK43_16370 [Ligilactobacillus salitolerans]